MTRISFCKSFLIKENNTEYSTWPIYRIKNDYAKAKKITRLQIAKKDYINSTLNKQKLQKAKNDNKSFTKESVENEDLYWTK